MLKQKKMKKIILFALIICSIQCSITAQEIKIGFKAGLNSSKFSGPVEIDDAGKTVEEFKSNTGFIVGVTAAVPFTKMFGARAEFIYSTNGGRKVFESQNAYQKFKTANNTDLIVYGPKRVNINTFNSYIQIPLLVYGKFFDKIEVSAGVCPSFLVSSKGTGELRQDITVNNNLEGSVLIQDLDFNYLKDNVDTRIGDPLNFSLISEDIQTRSTLSAYENYPEKKGNFYNGFDLGILAGLSYYFNSSLFVGARLYYGLNDVTNDDYDISLQKLDANKNYIYRNDKDYNVDIQFLIGFQF